MNPRLYVRRGGLLGRWLVVWRAPGGPAVLGLRSDAVAWDAWRPRYPAGP